MQRHPGELTRPTGSVNSFRSDSFDYHISRGPAREHKVIHDLARGVEAPPTAPSDPPAYDQRSRLGNARGLSGPSPPSLAQLPGPRPSAKASPFVAGSLRATGSRAHTSPSHHASFPSDLSTPRCALADPIGATRVHTAGGTLVRISTAPLRKKAFVPAMRITPRLSTPTSRSTSLAQSPSKGEGSSAARLGLDETRARRRRGEEMGGGGYDRIVIGSVRRSENRAVYHRISYRTIGEAVR